MSTKIWVAYRLLRKKDLWDVAQSIHTQATANASQVLRSIYNQRLRGFADSDPEFQTFLRKMKQKRPVTRADRILFLHNQIHGEYRKQLLSPCIDYYDFDAWVWFREYKGVISLIPRAHSVMTDIFDFMEEDPRLTDWHYQNQVSPDDAEEKDPKDWKRRSKYYDNLDNSGRWRSYLLLSICDKDTLAEVDPWLRMIQEGSKKAQVKTPPCKKP